MDEIKLNNGVVWVCGAQVIALIDEMLTVKRFTRVEFLDEAVQQIRAGRDPFAAMGAFQQRFAVSAITTVTFVPEAGDLSIRSLDASVIWLRSVPEAHGNALLQELRLHLAPDASIHSGIAKGTDLHDPPHILFGSFVFRGKRWFLDSPFWTNQELLIALRHLNWAGITFRILTASGVLYTAFQLGGEYGLEMLAAVFVFILWRLTKWYVALPDRFWFEISRG